MSRIGDVVSLSVEELSVVVDVVELDVVEVYFVTMFAWVALGSLYTGASVVPTVTPAGSLPD